MIKVLCMYCGELIEEKEADGKDMESHGICPICYEKVLADEGFPPIPVSDLEKDDGSQKALSLSSFMVV